MGVIGFDARHYQRLDRFSILAVRAAGAASFGSEKMLYFLGGMENWLNTKFSQDVPIPTEGFAYQTVAANLRGFGSNIRNGSSYMLLNAELRVPVFNYLAQRTIKSSFLRNFQLTAFFDAGTAWTGLSPFQTDNPLNTYTSNNPFSPIQITVHYFRQPLVYGYGFGVRTILFGYYAKLDYGWGVETGKVQDPMLYFTIGYDF
jgi:outer membrane protein assembly factor BamA